MSLPVFRPSRSGEEAQLIQIWCQAYDGDLSGALAYHHHLYHPGCATVAEMDGRLVSAIYRIEGIRLLLPHRPPLHCTYLFALGTSPACRSRGYGSQTICRAGADAYAEGAEVVCLLPASPSLYGWYRSFLGTRSLFQRRVFSVKATPVAGTVTPLSPQAYFSLREALLQGTPHAEIPVPVIALQGDYCRQYGGELVQVQVGAATGVAAYDRNQNRLTFRELLFPHASPVEAARAVLQYAGATSAQVRTPVFWHEGLGEIQEDVVVIPGGAPLPSSPPWWGLGMD